MKNIAAIIFLGALSFGAEATVDTDKLWSLIQNGQSAEAWEYARTGLDEQQGDARFDFYYGIAAIDSGHVREGVAALERVLKKDPEHQLARIELARGYLALGDDARARTQFEIALRADPPENIRLSIERYLDRIRSREAAVKTDYHATISAGAGTDSNVNSAPDSVSAYAQYIGYDPASIGDEFLAQDDRFATLGLDLGINSALKSSPVAYAYLHADTRRYADETDFDTDTLGGSAGLTWHADINSYTLELQLQKSALGGDDYRRLSGINTRWQQRWSKRSNGQLFLQYASMSYTDQPLRDINVFTLGAGFDHRFEAALAPVLSASVYLAQDSSTDGSRQAREIAGRDALGLDLGAALSLDRDTSVRLSLSYQTSDYSSADTSLLTPVVRKDNYLSSALDIYRLLDRHWRVSGRIQHLSNDSNIDANIYQRTQLSLTLYYDFI